MRILNALKIGWWCFKNPQAYQTWNFKIMTDLFCMIMKAASEHRHMMSRIAYVHPDEGEKSIVSIWIGSGMASDPLDRISELLKENDLLRSQLDSQLKEGITPIKTK